MSRDGKYIIIFIVSFIAFLCLFTSCLAIGQGFAEGGGTIRLFSHDIEADNNSTVIVGDDNNVQQPAQQPEKKSVLPFVILIVVAAGGVAFKLMTSQEGYL